MKELQDLYGAGLGLKFKLDKRLDEFELYKQYFTKKDTKLYTFIKQELIPDLYMLVSVDAQCHTFNDFIDNRLCDYFFRVSIKTINAIRYIENKLDVLRRNKTLCIDI